MKKFRKKLNAMYVGLMIDEDIAENGMITR